MAEARLLVLGAGGHGRVVADLARALGRYASIALLDGKFEAQGEHTVGAWRCVGPLERAEREAQVPDTHFALGLGDNTLRLRWLAKLDAWGAQVPALVHPSAAVSPDAQLGAGTVCMAQSAVNVGARLGRACIVNTGATVDHDCTLGDGVHLSPGANLGGEVTVGEQSWVGIGASVRHGITIGARTVVGAGAAVVKDLPDDVVAVGVPARVR